MDTADDVALLSEAALCFAELGPDDDVYQVVAEAVARVAPDTLVTASSYDPETHTTTLRALAGPSRVLARALDLFGGDLIGLRLPVDEGARRVLAEGKLAHLEGGLCQLAFYAIEGCAELERQLGIRRVYGQPLSRRGSFLGTMGLLVRRDQLERPHVVEAMIRLASVALQKRAVESQLRESEARYRQVAESLQDADRRKDEFIAVLSHELRNPLMAMGTSLQLLRRASPGSPQAERAQAVCERQVTHMTRLIDDLLDASRIVRGKILLRPAPLDLNALARSSVEDHQARFDDQGVALALEPWPADVVVEGDGARIAQVLDNLLQNALKFTPRKGRAQVIVAVDDSAREAVLRVCDTGAGISEDLRPHLFQAFTQADTSLDRSQGGLGLGLALVKGIVELHGGAARVDSPGPGLGTEVTIRLPLAKDVAPLPAGEDRERPPVQAPRRVLLIEDNVDAATSLAEALTLSGHAVEVAHEGPEGLLKAKALHPDVVLCDIGLPEMDGYAVARAFRADPDLADVRLVALSGYAGVEAVAAATAAGFDLHVAKPPSLEALERVIAASEPPDTAEVPA